MAGTPAFVDMTDEQLGARVRQLLETRRDAEEAVKKTDETIRSLTEQRKDFSATVNADNGRLNVLLFGEGA